MRQTKPEDKTDRIVKLLEKVFFLLLAIFLILPFSLVLYIYLCLMGGFDTELSILLIVSLIIVSCVSTYILVRLGWADRKDWTWKILLWMACINLAAILISLVVGLYSAYAIGIMTKTVILLIVFYTAYVLASFYAAVKLDLFGTGEPIEEHVLLFFILFLPIIYVWGLGGFFKEEPYGITILGMVSTLLLFVPLIGPPIILWLNPTALIEQPLEAMKSFLLLAGVGFPLYLLSTGMVRKLKVAWIGSILLSASCAFLGTYHLVTSFTNFEQRNLALVMIACGVPTTLYLSTNHVRAFFE